MARGDLILFEALMDELAALGVKFHDTPAKQVEAQTAEGSMDKWLKENTKQKEPV